MPPSRSGARPKAKLIRHVTQLQITLGIRAFLIPLLIPALYNWSFLQICFFLRADNRSCSDRRAFRRVWAAACLLQLPGPDPEVHSRDPPSGAICCAGTRKADWATRDALWPTQHHERFRDRRATWKRSALVESEARCPAGFWTSLFPRGEVLWDLKGLSRLIKWEIQIREIQPWHRQGLLKVGLVVERGPAEIPGVQSLY